MSFCYVYAWNASGAHPSAFSSKNKVCTSQMCKWTFSCTIKVILWSSNENVFITFFAVKITIPTSFNHFVCRTEIKWEKTVYRCQIWEITLMGEESVRCIVLASLHQLLLIMQKLFTFLWNKLPQQLTRSLIFSLSVCNNSLWALTVFNMSILSEDFNVNILRWLP
jgi:hypothetical protein